MTFSYPHNRLCFTVHENSKILSQWQCSKTKWSRRKNSERRKSKRTFIPLPQNRLNIWKTSYCYCFTSEIPKALWRSVIDDTTRASVDMDDTACDSARLSTFFALCTSDFAKVQQCTQLTDLFFPTWSPETARTRWHPEDSCYPGEEATRWGPQWLVLPWQAPGGGPGAPGFRAEGPSRQHLQAEQRQVSQVSISTLEIWINRINVELTVDV